MKVVLAFSGGLDTSFCVAFLREQYDADVVTVTVNTGGATREDLDLIALQSQDLGASEHREIDARQDVFDNWVSRLIRGNVLRGETYPLCVAAERTQQAIAVADVVRETGAAAVAHGSTGAGNDQVRFDVALRVLLDGTKIITPIRDLGLSRERAIGYLRERSLPFPESCERYSVNRGLWGTTVGGRWTHDPWCAPPDREEMSSNTSDSNANDSTEIVIEWKTGLPVRLGHTELSGPDLVEALGELSRSHAIGRGIHLGETVLGIKGRVGFEAGAALLLIAAHRELEKLTLTRWQAFWKDQVARFYGERLHEGQAFDPVMRDIEAMVDSSQQLVEGETRVRLSRGGFQVVGVRSPYSLHDPDVARYGETHALWSGDEARSFAKLSAIPSMLAARAREKSACKTPCV